MSDLIWASVMKSVGDESSGVCQSIVLYSAGKNTGCPAVVTAEHPVFLLELHSLCCYNNLSSGGETLFEVCFEVVDVLNTNAQANEAWGNAGRELLLRSELRVGGRSRVNYEATNVTDVREVAEQVEILNECATCVDAALELE